MLLAAANCAIGGQSSDHVGRIAQFLENFPRVFSEIGGRAPYARWRFLEAGGGAREANVADAWMIDGLDAVAGNDLRMIGNVLAAQNGGARDVSTIENTVAHWLDVLDRGRLEKVMISR